ncbi:hypothetical protein FHQ18_09620 [Deferribacter autotrophicus]|uniref:Uncharacterized protein n=1 Tax=Deferribacter autotrophicus TaxID=500465 RepID=A0A5A8F0C6_9BACT|nr:hypothetical protein [Deferribacter autotrophicus]KAA0257298.1 hypothetical protein FHQ18_09620 [Deferribacter autotrophicus]
MGKIIKLTSETYERLANLAKPFETEEALINRLIDFYIQQNNKSKVIRGYNEKDKVKKPLLIFHPDEFTFFKDILSKKIAYGIIYYKNGDKEYITWKAHKLKPTSNLRANLYSGYLRNWRKKGIVKFEISTNIDDLNLK